MASIQLSLGHRFVQLPAASLPNDGEGLLENVVPMSGQYRWLAVQAADTGHALEPGVHDPVNGYPVEPFTEYLDELLQGLVDPGIEYTVELFLLDHILRDGEWVKGFGHVFRVLAGGEVLTQEARVGGLDYEVETLVSVQVLD